MAIYGSACCVLVIALAHPVIAAETLTDGSSSKHLRTQTVNSLPYDQLNEQTKNKISDILNKPSIYRRLPVTAINADPDYFRFLVRYPEVIVNIWQLMGVTQMATERTGPYSINTNDGAGTISSLGLVYGSENLHIFYGTGTYEGPVLKRKLQGKAVLVLRSEASKGADGKPIATSQLDVFLKVDNATAGLIAKTIQPLVGSTADHNFVESLKFVQRLNETTEKNGPGVQQMGQKLKIDDSVRQQFNEVVDVVFQRAINSAAPLERHTSARPVRPAAETEYTPRSNYATPAPARTLDRSAPPQAPVYERLKDYSQINPNYPQTSSAHAQRSYQTPNGYELPARGYQAPTYANPAYANPAYANRYGQTIQAGYDYSHSQGQVQPAIGWRPQK